MKKFKWFFKEYKKSYILALILMGLAMGADLVPPLVLGRTADGIGNGSLDLNGLYMMTGLLLASIIASYLLTFGYSYLLFRGTDLMGREARRKLVKKLLKQGPIFYEQNTTGSLMSKATNDVRSMQDMAGFGMMSMVMTTIYPLVILIVMALRVSFIMTLISVLPLVLIVFTTRKISPRLYGAYRKIHEYFDRLNELVLENVNGVRLVRAFNKEESEEERFNEVSNSYYRANMDQTKYSAALPAITKFIPGLSYVLAFLYGANLISKGSISLGDLVSFVSLLSLLIRPASTFGEFINVFQLASASMDRLGQIFSYKEDLVDREDAQAYPGGGDLVFKDFNFNFPDGSPGLKDINLSLGHGKTLGLVGRVGSGKTTFLKQILRLYPVDEESLYLGARPIEAYKEASIRDYLGYVPQDHILFSKSIRDNISFGRSYSDQEIMEAVRLADFAKDLRAMPRGLDTQVGERGVSLSGGQKQRLAIARALILDPEILILDDSLSAVDGKTEQNILANLAQARKGRTTLIAAHRLSGISHADEIIVFDKGRIVERGSHRDLVAKGGWYSSQYKAQKLGEDSHEEG